MDERAGRFAADVVSQILAGDRARLFLSRVTNHLHDHAACTGGVAVPMDA